MPILTRSILMLMIATVAFPVGLLMLAGAREAPTGLLAAALYIAAAGVCALSVLAIVAIGRE